MPILSLQVPPDPTLQYGRNVNEHHLLQYKHKVVSPFITNMLMLPNHNLLPWNQEIHSKSISNPQIE